MNVLFKFSKRFIKKTFNLFGLDIIRNRPTYFLLGLRNLSFRTIIDVGANKGQFAKHMLKVFPEAHVYCFEPLQEPYRELVRWAEKQNGKVTPFNLAIGEKEGIVEMFHHTEHNPSSSFLETTKICEGYYPFTKKQVPAEVEMTTLDHWLDNLSFPLKPEILIKLDVQGYEDRVVRGGAKTFRMAKGCILEVSLDLLYKSQPTFRGLLDILSELGFTYAGNLSQVPATDGHIVYIDSVFIK